MIASRKVTKYVDACIEVEALREAVRQDGVVRSRQNSLNFAIARKVELQRALTGRDLGEAQRILIGLSMSQLARGLAS